MEMSAKSNTSPSTVEEPALKFGPPWLRALSHGNSTASPPVSPDTPAPKYKLAQYRYGREEMLALFSKDAKIPECLNEFDYLTAEKCQMPLALLQVTEEEQRIWSRSINSDMAVRGSSKGPSGPGNGMPRGGRGGSVDRGRGRGRGGYHPRGFAFEDGENGSLSGYSRLRPIERSQSVNEKDQRWEERDRRFERPFAGRTGSILDDTSGIIKQDGARAPTENWRRTEKDDENSGWRTNNTSRGTDRFGNRGSWRNHNDRERCKNDVDGVKDKAQHKDTVLNGPGKNTTSHPRQRSASGHFWEDDTGVDKLPEWSIDEDTTADVGTFDSSGAFLETKQSLNNASKEEIFVSDDELEECKPKEERPHPKSVAKQKENVPAKAVAKTKPTTKPPTVHSKSPPSAAQKKPVETTVLKTSCETELIDKPPCNVLQEEVHVPQTRTLPSQPFVVTPTISSVPTVSALLGVQKNIITTACNIPPPTSLNDVPGLIEEDTFAHHKTATENMMAQWTQEEEQRVTSDTIDKSIVLPIHHNDAYKWFYRDPQGEIQGPFTSNTMFEWLNGGFFTKELRIKRGCDERFVQLGELTQLWKRIPFQPGNEPPPLRAAPIATELSTPFTQSTPLSNHTSLPLQFPQPDTTAALQQQLLQQYLYRQVQMQQAASQLKQIDSFVSLPVQQQARVLQELNAQLHPEQQIPRSGASAVGESSLIDQASSPPFPLLGLNLPTTMLKNNLSLWNTLSQNPGNWATGGRPTAKAPTGGIWDTDATIPTPIERNAAEEEEKHRLALETIKRLEEENKRKEEKRKEEELKRKEEERILREIQKQQEEEKKRLEELQRLKEEEQRRLEEIRKEEERRREELRLQEERRKEEQRLLDEQRIREEQRIRAELEEQKRREKALEELRQQEERRKLEEKRQEEMQRKLWEQEQQERLREVEKQKEVLRLKEQEEYELKRRREAVEKERDLQLKRESENCARLVEQKGPAWGLQPAEKPAVELSLPDIQKLQEQKEKEQKERLKFQQQLLQQQQTLKQVQSNKNGLSWGQRANENMTSVKSLAEIQMEEAQQMAHQQKAQKTAATTVQATAASGVWGNSSQINRVSAAPTWTPNTNCFWDDALKSTTAQNPAKTKDCAFPALSNCNKSSTVNSNKNKNLRAKRDEDAVIRLFETHRKSNDEFTSWCTDALSHFPSSVDVPTFVAFLKDVESPYEVYDYVRSYLGDGKEAKEFGKQFLERRSKYRNQTKQSPAEENMWGPAPAITPAVNKAAAQPVNDCDATLCTKGKAKKKKNKMQKVDNSMLGFTVQPNSDRVNIGEIDRVEGM